MRSLSKIAFLVIIINLLFCFYVYALDKNLKEKRSTHFIVYYEQGVDRDFVEDIIDSAETYYEEIADNLGYRRYNFWLWDERANIYIFKNKSSYQIETNQPDWSGGCASYRDKKIWTYPHAAGFFDSILPHELGHIVFREFVGFDNNIPLWFEEGIASYQEKSKRYAAKSMVRDLITKDELLTLQDLTSIRSARDITDNEVAEKFYAQAVSIIYYLKNKFDDHRFAILCRSLREGDNLDKALDETYFNIEDTEGLYKSWIEYMDDE